MWPKALAQLIELAPHITRLIPMADRFLQSKSADAEASRNALEQMAHGLRGDLGQVTASHAGLYRQLNDHGQQLSHISADVNTVKLSTNSLDDRITHLEQQSSKLFLALGIALLLLIVICILTILILVHLH
jgi:hypothetical protein